MKQLMVGYLHPLLVLPTTDMRDTVQTNLMLMPKQAVVHNTRSSTLQNGHILQVCVVLNKTTPA
jgi:hypothetical protein